MRYQRLEVSSVELDNEENKWWDDNALTIESIWAHTKDWQKSIRGHYLKKAKRFFSSSNKQIEVLELGCGSGWVGRQIADKNCRIIGTDFSKEQILLAKELSKKYGLEEYCNYEIADSTDFDKKYDGVLIHAFLHHLSKTELDKFFSNIAKVPNGTKVFMYEPVFVSPAKGNFLIRFFSRIFRSCIGFFIRVVSWYIGRGNKVNNELKNKMDKITTQSVEKKWFLSPKEVPFYEEEIYEQLQKLFLINKTFWVNSTDFYIAQISMLYNKQKPNWFDRTVIMSIARFFDRVYLNTFCKYDTLKNEYHFKCFELVVKK